MADERELRQIIDDLKSPRSFVREKAVESLTRIRDENAVQILWQLVKNEIDYVKVQFCRFLGKLRSAQGVDPLIHLLKSPSENVAAEATFALDQIDHDRKTESLMHLVKDPNHFVRTYAIKNLGAEKKIKAVPTLVDALLVSDVETKILLIDSLRQIGDAGATFSLIKLLHDPEPSVVYQAIYALGEIGDKTAALALFPYLAHDEPRVRRAVVWSIGKLGYEKALTKFFEMLKNDPDDEVREEICKRMARFAGSEVIKALLFARAFDKSHNVRVYANWILSEFSPEEKKGVLLQYVNDSSDALRGDVLLELGKTGDSAFLGTLKSALNKDLSETVRARAVEGLAFFNTPDVMTDLVKALEDKEAVRTSAAESIYQKSGPDDRLLAFKMIHGAYGKDAAIRLAGIRILEKIYAAENPSQDVWEFLGRLLASADFDLKEPVLRCIRRIGKAQDVATLEGMRRQIPDRWVSGQLKEVLEVLKTRVSRAPVS